MYNRYTIAILAGLFACVATAHAQYADTFLVSVADKTPEHPYYGQGYNQGYVVNGRQSPTITLIRDSLYLFNTREVPGALTFQFYSIPIGGTQGLYSEHVEEHIVSQGLWTIKASDETPDTLYYASTRQPWVGGTILIVDSIVSSVEDMGERNVVAILAGVIAYPNPFAEETELRFQLDVPSDVRVDVIDAVGRRVITHDAGTMQPGERTILLNGAGLAAGVYLYRIEALSSERRFVATGKIQVR